MIVIVLVLDQCGQVYDYDYEHEQEHELTQMRILFVMFRLLFRLIALRFVSKIVTRLFASRASGAAARTAASRARR